MSASTNGRGEPTAKRVVVFGALGNVGQQLARECVRQGYQTSVAVRRPGALAEAFDAETLAKLTVHEVDSLDPVAVRGAMQGADVALNAAGNARKGADFVRICDVFITEAERVLANERRVWLLGGLAAMNMPNTNLPGYALPGLPVGFKLHRFNLRTLRESNLTWSMACPGPMVKSYSKPRQGPLRISIEDMPVAFPASASSYPKPLLMLALLRRMRELMVSYEDVARVMIENLSPESGFVRRRVGFALPAA